MKVGSERLQILYLEATQQSGFADDYARLVDAWKKWEICWWGADKNCVPAREQADQIHREISDRYFIMVAGKPKHLAQFKFWLLVSSEREAKGLPAIPLA